METCNHSAFDAELHRSLGPSGLLPADAQPVQHAQAALSTGAVRLSQPPRTVSNPGTLLPAGASTVEIPQHLRDMDLVGERQEILGLPHLILFASFGMHVFVSLHVMLLPGGHVICSG